MQQAPERVPGRVVGAAGLAPALCQEAVLKTAASTSFATPPVLDFVYRHKRDTEFAPPAARLAGRFALHNTPEGGTATPN